ALRAIFPLDGQFLANGLNIQRFHTAQFTRGWLTASIHSLDRPRLLPAESSRNRQLCVCRSQRPPAKPRLEGAGAAQSRPALRAEAPQYCTADIPVCRIAGFQPACCTASQDAPEYANGLPTGMSAKRQTGMSALR